MKPDQPHIDPQPKRSLEDVFLLFDRVADLEAEVKFLRGEVKRLADPNLTKETVAILTNYSETTIEAAMRDNELKFEKNGRAVRFRLSDVIAWRKRFYIQGKKKKLRVA